MYLVRRRFGQTLEDDRASIPAPMIPASTVMPVAAAAASAALIIFLLPGAITLGLLGLGIYAIVKTRKKRRRRRKR